MRRQCACDGAKSETFSHMSWVKHDSQFLFLVLMLLFEDMEEKYMKDQTIWNSSKYIIIVIGWLLLFICLLLH